MSPQGVDQKQIYHVCNVNDTQTHNLYHNSIRKNFHFDFERHTSIAHWYIVISFALG